MLQSIADVREAAQRKRGGIASLFVYPAQCTAEARKIDGVEAEDIDVDQADRPGEELGGGVGPGELVGIFPQFLAVGWCRSGRCWCVRGWCCCVRAWCWCLTSLCGFRAVEE